MINFTSTQLSLLKDALAIDVLIQKTVVAAANQIHKIESPDLKWIDATFGRVGEMVLIWENLRDKAGSAAWFGSEEVEAYFQYKMGEIPGHLSRAAERVRERIASGIVPEYKGSSMKILTYVPEHFHNAETFKIAGMLGFSLD